MMLHDLLCGDPLLPADLEKLGPIGTVILEVDPWMFLIISHWHLLTAVNLHNNFIIYS